MSLRPGTRFGPYEILALLGVGGMGEVYQARDTRLNRAVALKFLRSDRVADPDRHRRFANEAQAASALNHPGIITIFDISDADGAAFIVMEFVRGRTLEELIAGLRSRMERYRYATEIADALAAAHTAGIIHRDLPLLMYRPISASKRSKLSGVSGKSEQGLCLKSQLRDLSRRPGRSG